MPRYPKQRRSPGLRTTIGRQSAAIVRRSFGIVKRIRLLPTILSPADVLTLGNGFCGLLAIAVFTQVVELYKRPFFPFLTRFWPSLADDRYLLGVLLLTVGLMCDALDGVVARKFGGSRLGADLDTLSDTTTFVVAPALMVMSRYGHELSFPAFLTGSLVFIMGMLRLARFNTNPTESETLTFEGLPSPWCAITIGVTILAQVKAEHALPFISFLAFLMMSPFSYPKSRERVRYLPYLMIVSALLVVGLIYSFPTEQSRIMRTVLVVVGLTVALFPFLIARRERIEKRREAAANGRGAQPRSDD